MLSLLDYCNFSHNISSKEISICLLHSFGSLNFFCDKCFLFTFIFLLYNWNKIDSFIHSPAQFILKKSISKPDDLFENIASVIPSEDEVVLIEEKASVYLKDIKGALSSRFNCSIRFMACGVYQKDSGCH